VKKPRSAERGFFCYNFSSFIRSAWSAAWMAVRFLCLYSQFQCVKGFSGILSRVILRFVLDVFLLFRWGHWPHFSNSANPAFPTENRWFSVISDSRLKVVAPLDSE
jgi:hypothetical protein